MLLGVASAIYHTPSSPAPQLSSTPEASSATSFYQSPAQQPSSINQRPFVRQGPQVFGTFTGLWDMAFERQGYYFDNVNRPWCRREVDFSTCSTIYPLFGYPYQQVWNGPGGRRFWR